MTECTFKYSNICMYIYIYLYKYNIYTYIYIYMHNLYNYNTGTLCIMRSYPLNTIMAVNIGLNLDLRLAENGDSYFKNNILLLYHSDNTS